MDQCAAKLIDLNTEAVCDDVENAVGDILCDALDELESVLLAEDSVLLDAEEIRPVRPERPPAHSLAREFRVTFPTPTPVRRAVRGPCHV
eukprot:SAG11_NODE_1759_length_4305_cov_3.542558_1_plen_90_part_00